MEENKEQSEEENWLVSLQWPDTNVIQLNPENWHWYSTNK